MWRVCSERKARVGGFGSHKMGTLHSWPDLDSTCNEDCTDAVALMQRFQLKATAKTQPVATSTISHKKQMDRGSKIMEEHQ